MLFSTSVMVLGFTAVTKAIPFPENSSSSSWMPDIAAITAVDPSSFPSYQTGGLIRANGSTTASYNPVAKRDCPVGLDYCCANSPILTWVCNQIPIFQDCKTNQHQGEAYTGGPGINITNGHPSNYYGFYVYENSCDSIVRTLD
jgi:hypothetical protein